MDTFDIITAAADSLKAVLPQGFVPQIGIICGSGLSGIANAIEGFGYTPNEISYSEIKGFPVSTVQVRKFLSRSPSCGSHHGWKSV